MKILVFDTEIEGHHLEYINHVYTKALTDKNNEYVFVIPEKFNELKTNLIWEFSDKVSFDLLSAEECNRCNQKSLLKASWNKTITLKQRIKKNHVSHVFLVVLIHFLPFLPILIHNIKISGIIYQIYLYKWTELNAIQKILELIKYKLITKSKLFSNVYILNDHSASVYLNKKYSTSKFNYLPDPIVAQNIRPVNVRDKLNIPPFSKVFLHFGSLTKRKGTLEILKAIQLIPEEDANQYTFIFAGKISDDINSDFIRLYDILKSKVKILVFNYFCDYLFIANLCYSSDYLLIPYYNSAQSSGVLGYASLFGIPVIGPAENLLGKLIRKNRLGLTIKDIEPDSIYIGIQYAIQRKVRINDKYLMDHQIQNFSTKIINEYSNL